MNPKTLHKKLCEDFNITQGKRFKYSEKQAWFLTKHERVYARLLENYIKPKKSVLATDLYAIKELVVFFPNNNTRRAMVKYLVLFLKTLGVIKVKCNNGYKIISWNQDRERRLRRKRRQSRG